MERDSKSLLSQEIDTDQDHEGETHRDLWTELMRAQGLYTNSWGPCMRRNQSPLHVDDSIVALCTYPQTLLEAKLKSN